MMAKTTEGRIDRAQAADHQVQAARALVLLLEAQALRKADLNGYVEKAITLETRARWMLAEIVAVPGCGSATRVLEALS